jgi:radical SAM protein
MVDLKTHDRRLAMNRGFSPTHTRADFDHSPMVVFYETTRACDLCCAHCRADAQRWRDPRELTSAQARRLVEQLAEFPKPPLLVLTGGDPMKRQDVFELVEHAVSVGLTVAMTPSATPLVTADAVRRLKQSGLHRLALSLDGADAATHDRFRRVNGSFNRTFQIMADARACTLPLQVNSTIARHNIEQVDAIAQLLAGQNIELWSVFFLVPTGRASVGQRISAEEYEHVFERLLYHTRAQPYAIKTTEAPHYRRFIMRRQKIEPTASPAISARFAGTNDGKGVLFVGRTGEIYPSGFLPIECGVFPRDSVVTVYQQHATFRALRDGDLLGGKCGACEFRHVCGGSRARSFALTGDQLAAEPDCAYQPVGWTGETALANARHETV